MAGVMRCGRHISQLKPFTGPFLRGALLVKGFRPMGLSDVASWECRDCFPLSEGEFMEILKATGRLNLKS
jgi:hypothetical protein